MTVTKSQANTIAPVSYDYTTLENLVVISQHFFRVKKKTIAKKTEFFLSAVNGVCENELTL